MKVTLKKAIRLAKNVPLSLPGQVVEVDESQFARLSGLGTFVDEPDTAEATESDAVAGVSDSDAEAWAEDQADVPAEASESVPVSDKPKPTDSIDKHREYAKKVGIDPKGLSRAQLIKAIKDK